MELGEGIENHFVVCQAGMAASDDSSDISDDSPLLGESDIEEEVNEVVEEMDVDLEAISDEEYRQARSQVDLNPYSFTAHAAWIKAQERKHGRGSEPSMISRNEAHALFPLPEAFWLDWLQAEKYTFQNQDEETSNIGKYINRVHEVVIMCQEDFQSIPVWLFFIHEIKNAYKDGKIKLEEVRVAHEEAIEKAGRNFQTSAKIWQSFRDFEISVLESYEALEKSGFPVDVQEQEKRTRKAFFRELSTPLESSEKSYAEYRAWEARRGSKLPGHIKKTFSKTKKLFLERTPFELSIQIPDTHTFETPCYESLPKWLAYIDWESTPRIIGLFERAVATLGLSVDIWYRYCKFALLFLLKTDPVRALLICKRATRNCVWSGSLWHFYLQTAEAVAPNDFPTIFQASISSGIQSPEELAVLYKANINFWWRKLEFWSLESPESLDQEKVKQFREAMVVAKKYFGEKQLADVHSSLSIESILYESIIKQKTPDIKACQRIVDRYPEREEVWQKMIESQLSLPPSKGEIPIHRIRDWYKDAFKNSVRWSQPLSDQWIWFERIHGSLLSLLDAERIIEKKRIEWLKKYAAEQEKQAAEASSLLQKRKRDFSSADPHAKKQKISERSDRTVYVSNLPWKKEDGTAMDVDTTETLIREAFAVASFGDVESIRVIKNNENKLTGFAYVDFCMEESVHSALKSDLPIVICGRTIKIQKPAVKEKKAQPVPLKEPVKEPYTDKNTVFVSNLPFKATDGEIKELLSECAIQEIRLNRNSKNGYLLGFGYVEMKDENSVQNALTLDKSDFKGRKINVAISVPKSKRKARAPEDRPAAIVTKDAEKTSEEVFKLSKGNLFAPRSLLTKVALKSTTSAVAPDNTEKAKNKPKSNADFKKLFEPTN